MTVNAPVTACPPAGTLPDVDRWRRLLALVVASAALTACGAIRYTRDQVRDRWVNTYVSKLHLSRPEAECIVDRFFGELNDAELKPLTKGNELTDAQAQRIGELAIACGVGKVPITPTTASV